MTKDNSKYERIVVSPCSPDEPEIFKLFRDKLENLYGEYGSLNDFLQHPNFKSFEDCVKAENRRRIDKYGISDALQIGTFADSRGIRYTYGVAHIGHGVLFETHEHNLANIRPVNPTSDIGSLTEQSLNLT